MFLSLIGSFIYALQLNHQNTFSGSLGRTSKSSSVFGLQMCLWAPCNFLHMLFLSSKWLLQENWGNKDNGEGLPRTGFLLRTKCHAAQPREMSAILLDCHPSFQTAMTKMAKKITEIILKFFFDIEIIHRLLCTWQPILSEELETEASVGGHEVARATVCRQCHDEGNEGTLAPWPCLRPPTPSLPIPPDCAEFGTSSTGGQSSSLGHPQAGGSPEWLGWGADDKMPRGMWITVGCAWASPDILGTFSMASDQT